MVVGKVKQVWFKIFGNSIDPLQVLPKKTVEKILSFVRGNDLLTLSLVSKDWYKFIASSEECMDKIRIHITEYFVNQKRVFAISDVLRFVENGRNYKHLSVACISSYYNRLEQFSPEHKLLMAFFRWKSISLCNHSFKDEMEFVNFLGFVEPFVEEIELRTVKIQDFVGICETHFEFPRLKILRLVNVDNFVYKEPFKIIYKLEELSVATEPFLPSYKDYSDEIHERVQSIMKILKNNHHIKDLELFIEQKDFDCMFVNRDLFAQIKFRLEILMVGRFKKLMNLGRNHYQLKTFAGFLRLHKLSLREVYLPQYLGKEILEITINEMDSLKNMTIHEVEAYENCGDMNFKPNFSIESLNTIPKQYTALVSKVIGSLPRLKHLNTGTIDQRILNVLVERTPLLESITADYFTAKLPPKHPLLLNLKRIAISINTSENFQDLIGEKDEYTNFEEVFLKSSKQLRRRWDVNNISFYKW